MALVEKIGVLLVAGIALLAGCSAMTPTAPATPSSSSSSVVCDAAPVQGKAGQMATAQLGAELLRLTGARALRWLAPGMAATMDFRTDRLTVRYDHNMAIVSIACG